MDAIMGLAYPLSKTGHFADKQLANAILQEGLMAELFTSEPTTLPRACIRSSIPQADTQDRSICS
jgi:hypothetical protein